jgi:hypothetical protein
LSHLETGKMPKPKLATLHKWAVALGRKLDVELTAGVKERAGIVECSCAVQRRRSSVGAIPTWQLLLQPVAIGAVAEVTKLPKPSMERTVLAVPRAGRP